MEQKKHNDYRDKLYWQDISRSQILKDKNENDRQIKKDKFTTYIGYFILYGGIAFFLMWLLLS